MEVAISNVPPMLSSYIVYDSCKHVYMLVTAAVFSLLPSLLLSAISCSSDGEVTTVDGAFSLLVMHYNGPPNKA